MRWLAFVLLVQACATPPARPLPPLPPPVDIGSLVPPAPGPLAVPPAVRRYPDQVVRAGQCRGLPPGILVSPAVYAEGIATAQDRKRLAVEVAALERARRADREAAVGLEQACRARVAELSELVERERRLSVWRAAALVVFGVLGGAVVAVLARPR